jgi:ABC-type anion transport system duplicated permease subunit
MTSIEAAVLQYGALGILAVLLVGLNVIAREWLKSDAARRDAELAAAASREEFQRAMLNKWIEQAAATGNLAQQTSVATTEMVKQTQEYFATSQREHQAQLTAQQAMARALEILCVKLGNGGFRSGSPQG